MNSNAVFWILLPLYLTSHINGITSLAALPAKEEIVVQKTFCNADRVFRLFGYDCSNMNLKDVPQHLRASVEVSKLFIFFELVFPLF